MPIMRAKYNAYVAYCRVEDRQPIPFARWLELKLIGMRFDYLSQAAEHAVHLITMRAALREAEEN